MTEIEAAIDLAEDLVDLKRGEFTFGKMTHAHMKMIAGALIRAVNGMEEAMDEAGAMLERAEGVIRKYSKGEVDIEIAKGYFRDKKSKRVKGDADPEVVQAETV